MDFFDRSLPVSAQRGIDDVAAAVASTAGLAWLHGQGSVINGFCTDSDLDLVAVWHRMPSAPVLGRSSDFTAANGIAMEQLELHGYEIDIQHVPLETFEHWLTLAERGDGWSGDRWPMPMHAAAGLAQGVVIADPGTIGSGMRARAGQPPQRAIDSVITQVAAATPGYLAEIDRALTRGDHWLHDLLSVRLHKDLYTAWFLCEGHYPPFPKHLQHWYRRLGTNIQVQQLEASYWSTTDRLARRSILAELGDAILAMVPKPGR